MPTTQVQQAAADGSESAAQAGTKAGQPDSGKGAGMLPERDAAVAAYHAALERQGRVEAAAA
jgi:hypothetical protein